MDSDAKWLREIASDGDYFACGISVEESERFKAVAARFDRLTAENERLREQIGGYPSVDDLRMAMVLCADENKRPREACQAALNRGTLTGSAESILRAALRGSEA